MDARRQVKKSMQSIYSPDFCGFVAKTRPSSPCGKCGAFKGVRFVKHHITYIPDKTSVLCEACHRRITKLNTKVVSVRKRGRLSDEEREFIFSWFLDERVVLQKFTCNKIMLLLLTMNSFLEEKDHQKASLRTKLFSEGEP